MSGKPRHPHRVISVEDDASIRQAPVEALEGAGNRAFATDGGAQVLAALDQLRPDLIPLDILLSELDGAELLARLRNHHAGASVPVVIPSNLADSLIDCIDPEAAKTIGVAAIPKSISLPALLDKFGRHLGPVGPLEAS